MSQIKPVKTLFFIIPWGSRGFLGSPLRPSVSPAGCFMVMGNLSEQFEEVETCSLRMSLTSNPCAKKWAVCLFWGRHAEKPLPEEHSAHGGPIISPGPWTRFRLWRQRGLGTESTQNHAGNPYKSMGISWNYIPKAKIPRPVAIVG